ncbi:MAG TPA: glycerophosphodiester phosphodiesterase family protein, partial [Burkholderiaceae bacterium]|nr:glycerophosphodiester phosphodiesterase family protein [Burkholderiaceae bacterium]
MMATSPWPYPRVLAHRGGGTLAPENTIAAIKIGIERGFRAVEFDAMLTADDVPVLMHDPTLERTAGVTGVISELDASTLARADVGSWHSPRFAGETVPTLERTLRFCREHGIWPNVEIKPAPGFEAVTGAVVARVTADVYSELIRRGGAHADRVEPRVPLLSSFAPEALIAAREVAPDLPRGWLVDDVPRDWHSELLQLG